MKQLEDGGLNYSWSSGLSTRDYFAAHAPADPQAWFEPVMPPKPTAPPSAEAFAFPEDFSGVGRGESDRNFIINLCASWQRDPHFDLAAYEVRPSDSFSREYCNALLAHVRPQLEAFEEAWKAYWDAANAWSTAREKQRLVQWPYAWAGAVLGFSMEPPEAAPQSLGAVVAADPAGSGIRRC